MKRKRILNNYQDNIKKNNLIKKCISGLADSQKISTFASAKYG